MLPVTVHRPWGSTMRGLHSRFAAVLTAVGCAVLSLVVAGGGAASGSVALRPGSVHVHVPAGWSSAQARFGALRPGPARPGGGQALASPAGAADAVTGQGSVVLGGSPGIPAASAKTRTVYVPIQCTASFCASGRPGHVVDVINARRCNAVITSGCAVVARAR